MLKKFTERELFRIFMKVHLIKKITIMDYVADNAQSSSPFSSWLSTLKVATYTLKIQKELVH